MLSTGCSAARLARVVRDDEVGSSNLPIPTESDVQVFYQGVLFLCFLLGLFDSLARLCIAKVVVNMMGAQFFLRIWYLVPFLSPVLRSNFSLTR